MPTISTRIEAPRGCGYRKAGGKYLVSAGISAPCGKLPLELNECPTCHAGIHFSRGWTWIDTGPLFADRPCQADALKCAPCPLFKDLGKAGLLWVGEKFYPTPGDWLKEADTMGISRRIHAIPRGFKLGETWVLVAHVKAITTTDAQGKPEHRRGIFHAFKPSAIEYVVKDEDSDEYLQSLEEMGITLVRVIRDVDAQATLPS